MSRPESLKVPGTVFLLSLGAGAVARLIDHLADFKLSYDIRDTLGRLNPEGAAECVKVLVRQSAQEITSRKSPSSE